VVGLIAWQLCHRWKSCHYLLNRRLGQPWAWSGCLMEKKISWHCQEPYHQFVGHPTWNLVTMLIELYGKLLCTVFNCIGLWLGPEKMFFKYRITLNAGLLYCDFTVKTCLAFDGDNYWPVRVGHVRFGLDIVTHSVWILFVS